MVEDGEVDARARIRGRRRHHDRLAAAHRRRLHAEGAGDRSRRGRRRRRLACLDRRRRRAAGGPESAGAAPGPVCYDLGGDDPDHHRRQCAARLHQPEPSGRRRAQAQRREGARGVRRKDRAAARHVARARRLRRASDRGLEHDPRHQGGVDRARPRPARLRAVRLRRQRAAVRGRHGGGARHPPHRGAALGRAVLVVRAALRRCRAPLRAHVPPAAAPGRSRRDRDGLGRARAPGERAARRRKALPARAHGSSARPRCTTRARATS